MILNAASDYRVYLFWITTIFQTNTLFKTNKCHQGGLLGAKGPGNCPQPPLNPALQGGTFPRAPNHCGGAESLQGRRMTEGGAEKSQQCHKCFLQHSRFASERSQVRIWGCQTCFLPRALSKLVTPLTTVQCLRSEELLRVFSCQFDYLDVDFLCFL